MNATTPQKQQELENIQFSKLINLKKNRIIPVICDDMVEYVTDKENNSIQDFIWEKFKDLLDKENDFIYYYLKSNYYYGMTCLEQSLRINGFDNTLHEIITEGFETGELKLKDEVVLFLKNGIFPLVITTLGFPIIEKMVYNANNQTEIKKFCRWYHYNERNNLPLTSPVNHIVYHIFDGEFPRSWVYNEQTLLKFMHSFHSGDYGAKNLSDMIIENANKSNSPLQLFVLGSILPDWLFRFLIYPLYKDKIKQSGGMWLSFDSITTELSSFLERNNYRQKTNIRDKQNPQLSELLYIPEKLSLTENTIETHRIFISYKRGGSTENEISQLNRIVEMLKNLVGADVNHCWVDTDRDLETGQRNIQYGDDYWKNIKNEINQRTLFVPIVTWNYLDAFENVNIEDDTKVNDAELPPVVREAFYALKREKDGEEIIIFPIVMKYSEREGKKEELNGGIVEVEYKKRLSLPEKGQENWITSFLSPREMYLYDDDNPIQIELPTLNG